MRRLLAAEGDQRHAIAAEIDARVREMITAIASEPVPVVITGWPEWLSIADRSTVVGQPIQELRRVSPEHAALLKRELDGLTLGGGTLLVQVGLEAGERLPAIPRGARARPRVRGTRPWLPHLDEQGRYSLTPESLAREHAQLLAAHSLIIDPFCGCGGDSIAFAEAGKRVFAFERDLTRLELARENAEAKGVGERITFAHADGVQGLERVLAMHPAAAVYLDPPWGGPDWNRASQEWSDIFSQPLPGAVWNAPQVLLKAPRALVPSSLPQVNSRWRIRPAWNPNPCSAAERILFLRALAQPE